jgi:hypothetical protein
MTLFSPPVFLVLALSAAAAVAPPGRAQPQKEVHAMSDDASIKADVTSLLAQYDQTRDPTLLEDAGDQIVREDGAIPPDPAEAGPAGHERLSLWVSLFTRFKRDLNPQFDPDKPPPNRVLPPKIGGMQMMPGVPPSQIPDPAARRQYEDDIANNKDRLTQFAVQLKLHEVHRALLERAAGSLKDAHQNLGLKPADIEAALAKADILPSDRNALSSGVLP